MNTKCFLWVFKVLGWFFMVSDGFRWVLLVIQGSRVDFHDSRWVLWFFKVRGSFFMVPSGFLWFFKVSGWFFEVLGGF